MRSLTVRRSIVLLSVLGYRLDAAVRQQITEYIDRVPQDVDRLSTSAVVVDYEFPNSWNTP